MPASAMLEALVVSAFDTMVVSDVKSLTALNLLRVRLPTVLVMVVVVDAVLRVVRSLRKEAVSVMHVEVEFAANFQTAPLQLKD